MDFCRELQKAVCKIEKGIKEVDELTNNGRRDDDLNTKNALLLLRDKHEEVVNIKKSSSQLLRSIRGGDVPFTHTVALVEKLMKRNQEILAETENHLQQYGYERPAVPQNVCAPPTDTKVSAPEPVDPMNTDEAVDSGQDESSPEHAQQHTPERCASPEVDPNRTPRLEDYGISESTMRLITGGKLLTEQRSAPRQDTFKVPCMAVPPVISRQMSTISSTWDTQTPQAFSHQGLFVTPGINIGGTATPAGQRGLGMLGSSPEGFGRGSLVTPSVAPTPLNDHSAPLTDMPRLHLRSDSSEGSLASPGHEDSSPIPPVLSTPGLRKLELPQQTPQMSRLQGMPTDNTDTPEPPILRTPGLKQLPRPNEFSKSTGASSKQQHGNLLTEETADNSTPEPPILRTPGLKQLPRPQDSSKPTGTGAQKQLFGSLPTDDFNDNNTPEPPLLRTPGIKQLQRPQNETPKSPLAVSIDPYNMEANCRTPEMPELTFDFGHMLKQHNVTQPHTVSRSPDKSVPQPKANPPPVVEAKSMKSNTPEMPELTFDFGHMLNMTQSQTVLNAADQSVLQNEPNHPPVPSVSQEADKSSCQEPPRPVSPSTSFLSQQPGLPSFEDVCNTPQYPDLTFSYKDLQSLTPAPPASVDTTQPSPAPPAMLTTSLPSTAPLSYPAPPSAAKDLGKKVPSSHRSIDSAIDKENACPNKANNRAAIKPDTDKSSHSKMDMSKGYFPEEISTMYIPFVTEDEYRAQPDYMCRILSLDKLNTTVKTLNTVFHTKISAKSGEALVCDLDLKSDLGSHQARVFFLCLMRLGYVTMKRNTSGQSYYGLS